MILQAIFFYLFAGVCIASAFMVIAAKNPVHSVLFLILAFFNATSWHHPDISILVVLLKHQYFLIFI